MLGPDGGQVVIFAVDTLKRFRSLMHVTLKANLHPELKRLVHERKRARISAAIDDDDAVLPFEIDPTPS
jgi:hypothetical protein